MTLQHWKQCDLAQSCDGVEHIGRRIQGPQGETGELAGGRRIPFLLGSLARVVVLVLRRFGLIWQSFKVAKVQSHESSL